MCINICGVVISGHRIKVSPAGRIESWSGNDDPRRSRGAEERRSATASSRVPLFSIYQCSQDTPHVHRGRPHDAQQCHRSHAIFCVGQRSLGTELQGSSAMGKIGKWTTWQAKENLEGKCSDAWREQTHISGPLTEGLIGVIFVAARRSLLGVTLEFAVTCWITKVASWELFYIFHGKLHLRSSV